MAPPSIPGPSRALGFKLEEAKGPSIRLATPKLPWSHSEATAQPLRPSEDPSTAPWEVTSLDLPVMAMLRAPKVWLLPHPTPLPTQASGVKGHSEAMATATPSPASETQVSPQDPIHPEMYSLPTSLGLTGQGREAMFLTFGDHEAGSPTAPSQVAMDTQAGTSPNSPRADFGETGETSPTGLGKTEHPRSSPQASVDGKVAADFTPMEMATEPLGGRGISGSESEVFSTAQSPTSGSQATMEEAQGMWPSLHSEQLDPLPTSAPLKGPGVSLNLEPWAATNGGDTVGPVDSTATVDPGDTDGIWKPGPRVAEGDESPTMSPQVAVDKNVVTSLMSLDQRDKGEVLVMSTVDSSSSQPHPEPEGQRVTWGTLGASALPHEGSLPGKPALAPWTSTAASMNKPVSESLGEPTVLFDSPSTLPPVPWVLDKFELEVLAGSASVEEEASGEEPALQGTSANGSAEQSEFKAGGLIQPTVVRALGPGARGAQSKEEGLSPGACEGF